MTLFTLSLFTIVWKSSPSFLFDVLFQIIKITFLEMFFWKPTSQQVAKLCLFFSHNRILTSMREEATTLQDFTPHLFPGIISKIIHFRNLWKIKAHDHTLLGITISKKIVTFPRPIVFILISQLFRHDFLLVLSHPLF